MITKRPVVFLSVSIKRDKRQERAVSLLKQHLSGLGVECISVENHTEKPVQTILEKIGRCDAMIIMAFERTKVREGVESRGTNNVRAVADETYTSVWHHIEGAMALTMNIPLLVLREKTLKREGIICDTEEWKLHPFSLDDGLEERNIFDPCVRHFLQENGLLEFSLPPLEAVRDRSDRLTARPC